MSASNFKKMKKTIFSCIVLLSCCGLIAQTNTYEISFENAVHHEAVITASFTDIGSDTLALRMSRTSPGRYALHEFAKNIYDFKATDADGIALAVSRPDPYQWLITGHSGTVHISYVLFANRGGGTYAQIDETHAHLNIPASFMYAPMLSERPIEVTFNARKDLNWKIATQLPRVSGNTYTAPNLYYFMDSPTEISNHQTRTFTVNSNNKDYEISLALHHNGTEAELDMYFEKVKKVVLAEMEVYGELPDFDYGSYTFLACYVPNASGDGMEHRNSTILTSTRSLANGGMERNIGTVSHEFFHAWNVERIRPKSLEPFSFEMANMSGELWFAEGFTSYYTNLILCRAGIISPERYVEGLTGTFNYVWNSPARHYFNPIEMSYQAPFVDAATSVDPVNRENTFISYYSYGSVLGLALDLSLRKIGLHLDDYMKEVWNAYGKNEIPYTIQDLHTSLNAYAGKTFGDQFFDSYIYQSGMPNYKTLFEEVGVQLSQEENTPYFGAFVSINTDLEGRIQNNPKKDSPAYLAGLSKGDQLLTINGAPFTEGQIFNELLKGYKVGDTLELTFLRFSEKKKTTVTLTANPSYVISLIEKGGLIPSATVLKNRKAWLKTE